MDGRDRFALHPYQHDNDAVGRHAGGDGRIERARHRLGRAHRQRRRERRSASGFQCHQSDFTYPEANKQDWELN